MYSVNREANGEWISHKSCGVGVSFPSDDLDELAGCEAWVEREGREGGKHPMIYGRAERGGP